MKAITVTGALLALGMVASGPALAQDKSMGAMQGNSMGMPSGSMGKMSKSQMATMKRCQAMSSDMMMKDKKCAAMAKMHPEMMQGGMMGGGH